jgi:mxaJ protein
MACKLAALVWALIAAATAIGAPARAQDSKALRVCADPDNLPFSNSKSEGFENKIAEVVARDLGMTLEYYWWPHQRGLVRNTLTAGACDVLISIPKGYDPVLWTKPYYRSAYVLVQNGGNGRTIKSLDDPGLKQLRIGTHAGTPPYDALAERGLADRLVTYPLFFDPRVTAPSHRPTKLLEDLVSGEVDVAVAWGPTAGYFAKTASTRSSLSLVPLADERTVPMTFEFSMGVRKGNQALKRQLEESIDRRQSDITKVLADYGVPLLPLEPPKAGGEAAPPGKPREVPGAHKHQH